MKLINKLAFILSMILLLGILVGCTPKTQETTESYTLPVLDSDSEGLPENETAAPDSAPSASEQESDPEKPGPIESESSLENPDPIKTESGPVTPETESANAGEPLSTEPSSEDRPTEPDAPDEQPTEDPGEDEGIEDDIIVTVDGDLGVGGN